MSAIALNESLGQLVAERPSRSVALERWGLDYCCGGKQSLAAACAAKGLDPFALMAELDQEATAAVTIELDWTTAPLAALIDHIGATHHAYLRGALPRLTDLTAKVSSAHGERNPYLCELAGIFAGFRDDLEDHMRKEEAVLFPFIRALETDDRLPEFACGSMGAAIERMELEHADSGAAIDRMRELTGGFAAPDDACNTYRAMLAALAELEIDLHRHVHKESSILFPRATVLEGERERGARETRDLTKSLR